jgi:hypothetical protein
MKKQSAFLVMGLSFLSLNSFAAPASFHCYSVPNVPVQTYEYASGNCGGLKSKDAGKELGKNSPDSEDGMKDVVCMYQAACRPGDNTLEPTDLPFQVLINEVASGDLKSAMLICKGRGRVNEKGQVIESMCPTPTKCQKDIFYNFVARTLSPGAPERLVTPKAKSENDGRSKRDQTPTPSVQ